VQPFHATRLKPEILNKLVLQGEVYEIEADEMPFTHRTDNFELIKEENIKVTRIHNKIDSLILNSNLEEIVEEKKEDANLPIET